MADYYTHFSCILDLGTPGKARRALEIYTDFAERLEREDGEAIRFNVSAEGSNPSQQIWISDDAGDGKPDHVLAYVCELGPLLGLTGHWGFEWANTCSKPRLEAFGGDAYVIDLATGESVACTTTHEWLTVTLADAEA